MRKLILSALVVVAMDSTAHAQTSFIGGVIAGYALSSATNPRSGPVDPTIVYTAPEEVLRRVDPLKIRHRSTWQMHFNDIRDTSTYAGKSNDELFRETLGKDNPDKYVVLQIVRVIGGDTTTRATFWFSYAEKEALSK